MSETEHILLEIEDLHIDFSTREGLVRATRGVTFDIRPCETVGLVGESGCGKSVTAQAILRIIPKPGRIVQGQILLYTAEQIDVRKVTDITTLKEKGEIRNEAVLQYLNRLADLLFALARYEEV